MTKSHESHRKIVHRPCSSCISSVQEINEDSIKFFLSTQTWSGFKLPWLKSYTYWFATEYILFQVKPTCNWVSVTTKWLSGLTGVTGKI